MIHKFITFVLMLSLVSILLNCSGKNPTRELSSTIAGPKFDLSLIHSLSSIPTKADIDPATLPFIAVYKSGDKELIYLSTLHSTDIKSKTHRGIDNTLKKLAPQGVIVELPTFNKNELQKFLSQCNISTQCVEGPYAYQKSTALNIFVTGGEPSDDLILKNALKRGLSKEEVLFFYVIRVVSSWNPADPKRQYNPQSPQSEITKYIESNATRLGLNELKFKYQDFLRIYEKGMGKKFNHRDVSYNYTAPYRDGNYIQKIASLVDITREESILLTVQRMLQDYDRIFVIYGSGHYLKHRPVLKKAFETEKVIPL